MRRYEQVAEMSRADLKLAYGSVLHQLNASPMFSFIQRTHADAERLGLTEEAAKAYQKVVYDTVHALEQQQRWALSREDYER